MLFTPKKGMHMIVLAIVFPLVTLAGAIVTLLTGNGRLTRNRLIGLRSIPADASDKSWRAGQRAAMIPAWIGFVLTAATAVTVSLGEAGNAGAATLPGRLALVAVFLGSVAWLLISMMRGARASGGA